MKKLFASIALFLSLACVADAFAPLQWLRDIRHENLSRRQARLDRVHGNMLKRAGYVPVPEADNKEGEKIQSPKKDEPKKK